MRSQSMRDAIGDWKRAILVPALWLNLALEDLRDRYRRTVLGVAWIAISFALFVGVKVLVFGRCPRRAPANSPSS